MMLIRLVKDADGMEAETRRLYTPEHETMRFSYVSSHYHQLSSHRSRVHVDCPRLNATPEASYGRTTVLTKHQAITGSPYV